ncbi:MULTISPECIES: hypothetical protein [Sinorhizobium]|uniref:hypothetical protein n=1 Tax=Sinorhizobium TaxID=28105 RepID=UPI00036BF8F1|nr:MULTISPECIES: hypothetical protein [Sinorhizobium]MDE3874621.1 hypothetical protein [Sinorhizobium meliloti]MDW9823705.1 hypothetical protein [Sinorhizobium meliloti]MDW9867222.1 hypothetical protein [Sinorhizobium meliloti]TWA32924.1 hypothetical protein FB007_1094 [Sinorhizobium medicae]
MAIKSQFKGFYNSLRRYFRAYGGWPELASSPLLWISVAITVLGYRNWLEPNWLSLSQELVPGLLGFSLGTYAILFSLMTGRLKLALKRVKNQRGVPFLDEINATFFHFIFVQVVALAWALLYDGSWLHDLAKIADQYTNSAMSIFVVMKAIGSFMGYLLLVYSFVLILAAALKIYRIASITDPSDE